jgi:hypothetical protein
MTVKNPRKDSMVLAAHPKQALDVKIDLINQIKYLWPLACWISSTADRIDMA